jgi:Alternative complex III, ActD subunit
MTQTPDRPGLLLAEFERASDILEAAEFVRDAGYTRWDVHSPFPIHGMDRAMGLEDSRVGWTVLVFALTGLVGAFVMMFWMAGIDYPFVAGGKPPGALPPMAPILFELTILFSAFGAVFGMLHLNRLPRHEHLVFESDRFRAASDDKFFISIEFADPKFDLERTRALLDRTRATNLELLEEILR